jgi:hypothetical protein
MWLATAGHSCDVALAPPFCGGVDWRTVDPTTYSHVLFVCGPFGNGWPINDFLSRFAGCHLVGLNLSMLEPLETWNPFELLFERDSSNVSRPDISYSSTQVLAPVVGIVLIDTQNEYGGRDSHVVANDAIRRLAASRPMAAVSIDTRLDINTTGLRSAAEVESLIAHMDVVLTTRLHGTVLALKNGIPVISIDSVIGGGKITRQAKTVGWPMVFQVEDLEDGSLQQAFDYCLTAEAKKRAQECAARARIAINQLRDQFVLALSSLR